MAAIRYHIVDEIPAEARTAEFATLADGELRIRLMVRDDELVVVASGADVRTCEELLRRLGATDIGVDLCG